MNDDQDYGTKIPYDSLWQGPLAKTRTCTNVPWIFVMLIYLCIWGGVAFYGIKNGNLDNFNQKSIQGNSYNNYNNFDGKTGSGGFDTYLNKRSVTEKSLGPIDMKGPIFTIFAATALITVGYILLMRWFAKLLVYFVIILICICLVAGTIFGTVKFAQEHKQEQLVMAISCAFIFVVIFIALLFLRRKINIACGVITESMKAVLDLPFTLVFPIVPTILLMIFGTFFTVAAVYLESIRHKAEKEHDDGTNTKISFFHAINTVGMIWIYFFITGFGRMTLAGTFSTWFWTRNKHMVPSFMVVRFAGTTIRYHLGTIALGSMIITICKIISAMLKSLRKAARESDSPAAQVCACCISCLFQAIEQFIRFITENAYIMCATHGTNFFTSAKDAFNLIMRNYVKVAVTTNVTAFIMMFGRFLITIAMVGISYFYLKGQNMNNDEYWMVMLLIVFGAFFVTECVMIVANVAIETIFLSALEDYERNDDSSERPYYMNRKLKNLFIKDEYHAISSA